MAPSGYCPRVIAIFINLPLVLGALALSARAQAVYDAEVYRDLINSSSAQTIPAGTTITPGNWTAYRRFIPIGLGHAFSGAYPMKNRHRTALQYRD